MITEHGVEIVMTATTKQVHLAPPCEHQLASQLVAQVMVASVGPSSLVDPTYDFFPEHVCMAATGSEPPVQPRHNELMVKTAVDIIKGLKQLPTQLPHLPGCYTGPQYDATGEVALTRQLNTKPVPRTFFTKSHLKILELFGGICVGLEATLKSGFVVEKYIYCDKDESVRHVAAHRLMQLQADYPSQLPSDAITGAFDSIPQDVRDITVSDLTQIGVCEGQWLVVAGFECQNLSAAGNGKGLYGSQSDTFSLW